VDEVDDVVAPVADEVVAPVVDEVDDVVGPVADEVVDEVVAPVVDEVDEVVRPVADEVVAPVVDEVDHVVGPVADEVVAPVVDEVVAPVVDEVVDVVAPVADEVVDEVVGPVADEVVDEVVGPVADEVVAPVVDEVVGPVADEVVAPVVDEVDAVVGPVAEEVDDVGWQPVDDVPPVSDSGAMDDQRPSPFVPAPAPVVGSGSSAWEPAEQIRPPGRTADDGEPTDPAVVSPLEGRVDPPIDPVVAPAGPGPQTPMVMEPSPSIEGGTAPWPAAVEAPEPSTPRTGTTSAPVARPWSGGAGSQQWERIVRADHRGAGASYGDEATGLRETGLRAPRADMAVDASDQGRASGPGAVPSTGPAAGAWPAGGRDGSTMLWAALALIGLIGLVVRYRLTERPHPAAG